MLIFKRPEHGKVIIAHGGQTLELTVGKIGRGYVELQFVAPSEFTIDRKEVADRKAAVVEAEIEEDLKQLADPKGRTF